MHQPIDPRPILKLPRLTAYQYDILRRLANSKSKVFAAVSGTPRDKKQNEINLQFNEILGLVELGLADDVSHEPKFAPLVEKYRVEQGRDCAVIHILLGADLMFRRYRWEKQVN